MTERHDDGDPRKDPSPKPFHPFKKKKVLFSTVFGVLLVVGILLFRHSLLRTAVDSDISGLRISNKRCYPLPTNNLKGQDQDHSAVTVKLWKSA